MTPKKSRRPNKKSGFQGIKPFLQRIWSGAPRLPKLRKTPGATPAPTADSNYNYEAMKPEAYRWFRQDELVRRCIVINAAYATMAAGFETELESIQELEDDAAEKAFQEKYKFVKDYVDAANKKVNLDRCLFVAQVKRSIFGKSAFEIEYDNDDAPEWLLSIKSQDIQPDIDDSWKLRGYKYKNNVKDGWGIDDNRILFFTNLALENDLEGLSDVEAIYSVCKARHNLLRRDLPEITRSLWAPYTILSADTSEMTEDKEDAFLTDLIDAAKSGKSLAINKQVDATVVDRKLNLTGLVALLEKLEEAIIRNFGTPRFLVNKPNENRATSYTEFEAFVGGTLSNIQRYFKRELEAQWYPWLVKQALKKEGASGTVEVKVQHVWTTIRATDVYNMASSVAALYANGLGILADDPEIGYDMMGWDKTKLLERMEQMTPQETPPKTQEKPKDEGLPGDEDVNDKPTS